MVYQHPTTSTPLSHLSSWSYSCSGIVYNQVSFDQFQNKNESCVGGRHHDCEILKYLPAWLFHWKRRGCEWWALNERKSSDFPFLWFRLQQKWVPDLILLLIRSPTPLKMQKGRSYLEGHSSCGTLWISRSQANQTLGPELPGSLSSGQLGSGNGNGRKMKKGNLPQQLPRPASEFACHLSLQRLVSNPDHRFGECFS